MSLLYIFCFAFFVFKSNATVVTTDDIFVRDDTAVQIFREVLKGRISIARMRYVNNPFFWIVDSGF